MNFYQVFPFKRTNLPETMLDVICAVQMFVKACIMRLCIMANRKMFFLQFVCASGFPHKSFTSKKFHLPFVVSFLQHTWPDQCNRKKCADRIFSCLPARVKKTKNLKATWQNFMACEPNKEKKCALFQVMVLL